MRLITAEEVIAMGPCSRYTEEVIRANHGPDGITARQIAELDIPIYDRVWVIGHLMSQSIRAGCYSGSHELELSLMLGYLEQHDETEGEG